MKYKDILVFFQMKVLIDFKGNCFVPMQFICRVQLNKYNLPVLLLKLSG